MYLTQIKLLKGFKNIILCQLTWGGNSYYINYIYWMWVSYTYEWCWHWHAVA